MAAGVQRVYGVNAVRVTQNDFNPLARLAAATPIVINHTNDFPTNWTETINQTFDAATRSPYVEWQNNSHPDVDTYHLLLGDTPLNPTPVITGGAQGIDEFTLENLAKFLRMQRLASKTLRGLGHGFVPEEAVVGPNEMRCRLLFDGDEQGTTVLKISALRCRSNAPLKVNFVYAMSD